MTEAPLRATVSQKAALFDGQGRLLVLKRPDGVWEFPGGRLGADEAPLVGLRREVHEETGLTVTVGPPVFTAAWRNDADQGRFAVVYRCEAEETAIRLSDEHVDGRWVGVAEARDLLTDRRVTALAQARADEGPVVDSWRDAPPLDATVDGDGGSDAATHSGGGRDAEGRSKRSDGAGRAGRDDGGGSEGS